ncbi:hypothetical protein KKI24_22625 [bacterium]|nr:hypothetical protein [bacterium]
MKPKRPEPTRSEIQAAIEQYQRKGGQIRKIQIDRESEELMQRMYLSVQAGRVGLAMM